MLKPYNKAEVTFDLIREIGQEGANSRTFVAHDHQLDAEIVIKQVALSKLDSADQYFEESKILYLTSHPNVVPVHYACKDVDHIYIAMPYYSRGSLNALINTRYLTVGEIVRFGCQIASGLHNVHSKRLVHFDIKPDNVLLSDRGEAVVSDFGLARRLSAAGTAGQDQFYFAMLPPEVFDRPEYTRAFDIYQFGVTLYRMCNGNEAFHKQFESYGTGAAFNRDAFKFDVRNGRFPDRKAFEEHIPERLRKVIKHCLEPDPAARPKAAVEVANALAEVGDKLDWQFSKVAGDRVWVRKDGEKGYRITVQQNGHALAEKTMNASGRCTKISEYCKTAITSREIRKFLGEHE